MSADESIVAQILNNIIRETREMAMHGSCIKVSYSVIEKRDFRYTERFTANSLLVFTISFVGNDEDVNQR